LIAGVLYWIQPYRIELRHENGRGNFIIPKGFPVMTYLDVVFRYVSKPSENELRAIDGMREVYGVRQVSFNEKDRTVRVEFDASRLKTDAVARLLRQAGIDVGEPLALA
jgi:hypothetical protein